RLSSRHLQVPPLRSVPRAESNSRSACPRDCAVAAGNSYCYKNELGIPRTTELIWDGKYKDGKKQGPVRIALPFQTIETVNESAQDRRRNLELFASGRDTEWRDRLIWGDKKYVLPSLLPELAGKVNLIYIDPPFDTGADFSFMATIPDNPDTPED